MFSQSVEIFCTTHGMHVELQTSVFQIKTQILNYLANIFFENVNVSNSKFERSF